MLEHLICCLWHMDSNILNVEVSSHLDAKYHAHSAPHSWCQAEKQLCFNPLVLPSTHCKHAWAKWIEPFPIFCGCYAKGMTAKKRGEAAFSMVVSNQDTIIHIPGFKNSLHHTHTCAYAENWCDVMCLWCITSNDSSSWSFAAYDCGV